MSLLRVLRLKRRFERVSSLQQERVLEIQQGKIRDLVRHAAASSAFYSGYGGAAGQPLASLPLTDKQRIMAAFDRVVTQPALTREALERHLSTAPVGRRFLGEYTVVHTSGSSGNIGIFVYDSLAWDTLKALILARCTDFGVRLPRKRLAFVGLTDGHYAGVTLASDVPRLLAAYCHVSVNEPVAQTVARLNRFQPGDLRGYASGLAILAAEQLAGRLSIRPANIVSSAEPLDGKTSALVEEAFGVAPYNFYAASEAIGMAQDCSLHRGLHVFNDNVVLEIVDGKGEQVAAGKEGHVVLTNLYNRCQPLIRYQMNDIAAYSKEECECGLPFPLLKTVSGRREEVLWVEKAGGGYETLHPISFVEFFVPGLRRLQVVQVRRNSLLLRVVAEGNAGAVRTMVLRRMGEILDGKGLKGLVDVDVELCEGIAPDPKTGKTRTVVSKVGPPQKL